jgi:maltose alpha-D-glucosyltransferase / alpha-amylase
LNWVRRLIRVRREHKVFSRGTFEFVPCHNRRVVAYVRAYQDQVALVVNNLSRFSQPVELDLSRYQGMALTEMGGNVQFPTVGELPYLITLGPHAFYWFRLERRA